ncbi:MAG: hypothetical protein D6722_24390, partial [Bacteroidetes bacterium]
DPNTGQSLCYEPLWYAIVAEKHPDLRLVDPLLDCILNPEDPYDFDDSLLEEASYLLSQLAETFPAEVPLKTLAALERMAARKEDCPSAIFVHDALRPLDLEQYGDRLLAYFQHPHCQSPEILAGTLANMGMVQAIPKIKSFLDLAKLDQKMASSSREADLFQFLITEYQAALDLLEGRKNEIFPPFHVLRSPWQTYFERLNTYLQEEEA